MSQVGRPQGVESLCYCYYLPFEQVQTLRPIECKLFIQSHVSLALAPSNTEEKPTFLFGPC